MVTPSGSDAGFALYIQREKCTIIILLAFSVGGLISLCPLVDGALAKFKFPWFSWPLSLIFSSDFKEQWVRLVWRPQLYSFSPNSSQAQEKSPGRLGKLYKVTKKK